MVIKWRQKISFLAFKNKRTVPELILIAIQKSYFELVNQGIYIQKDQELL